MGKLIKINDKLYINPDQIISVQRAHMAVGWFVSLPGETHGLNNEEAQPLLKLAESSVINSSKEDLPATWKNVHITRITADTFFSKTSGQYDPMYRIMTKEGYGFNVFMHADPNRNTAQLLLDALPDETSNQILNLSKDDYLTFNDHPILCTIEQDGKYWRLVAVNESAVYVPDQEEEDAPRDVDDIPFNDSVAALAGDPNFEQGKADHLTLDDLDEAVAQLPADTDVGFYWDGDEDDA